MKPLKVAIIGAGCGDHLAPFGDHDWECWGLNRCWVNYKSHESVERKYARWFELHRRGFLQWESEEEQAGFLRILRSLPVYVQDITEWPEMLTVQPFPFEQVQALAPEFANYHACSIDWMLAYAITEGATQIALYGVEQWHTAEPMSSRACLEFWAGFATARGIKVTSAEGSTFRLAQIVYTKTPYAFDPIWLPRRDEANEESTLRTETKRLEKIFQDG